MFIKNHFRLMEEEKGAADGGEVPGGGGESSTPSIEDLQKQLEAATAEKESMSNKLNELLGETKKAKEARKQAEAQAAAEAKAKAEAEGNFEQLFKSSESEREQLARQLEELQGNIAQKEVNQAAMKLAMQMNPLNDAAAEDLSKHIANRLKFTDDGVKVVDDAGNLTVSTVDDLKKEFEGSARYQFYLKGNQSSGGGATGGSSGSGASKEISRAEFNALDAVAKMKFIREQGGKVVD